MFLLAGLEVGGVGLAEPGLEFCAEEDCGTQDDLLLLLEEEVEARTGKASVRLGLGLFEEVTGEEILEALPQDLDCET
jgi:hypothetical protein